MSRLHAGRGLIQQIFFELNPSLATDLSGKWESYRVFLAPVNWRFRTRDRVEFNVNPTGERLVAPFEVADDVAIAPGSYHWRRYRLEAGTAQKRRVYTQVTWCGGSIRTSCWSSCSTRFVTRVSARPTKIRECVMQLADRVDRKEG